MAGGGLVIDGRARAAAWRSPAAWVTGLYALYLVLPILLLVLGSFGNTWSNTLLPNGFTGRWYLQVINDPSFTRAFWTSLTVCVATVAGCVVIGAPLAYAVSSAASRGVKLAARIVYLLPIAAPAVVIGFGYLLLFSSEATPWLGATWLIIAGHIVFCLPYMLQTVVNDMRLLGLSQLEQAAESLGASFPRRFVDIVLPSLKHSLAAGSITVAALSIGEFQLTNLIAGFANRTYPIVLLQAFYGATGFACAATVVLLLLALTASASSAFTAKGASGTARAGA